MRIYFSLYYDGFTGNIFVLKICFEFFDSKIYIKLQKSSSADKMRLDIELILNTDYKSEDGDSLSFFEDYILDLD